MTPMRMTPAAVLAALLSVVLCAHADTVAVFPFESTLDDGRIGAKAATKFRMKLARQGDHEVASELEGDEALAALAKRPAYDDAPAWARLGRDTLFADFALVGRVVESVGGYRVFYRLIDCREGGARVVLDESEACANEREISEIAKRFVRRFTGRPEEDAPPRPYEAVGPHLVRNGDFEKGDRSPAGWERIDNLTTFWKADGDPGRCLVIDTDVLEQQWKDWRAQLDAGADLERAPAKLATTPPYYDTIGGTYGVPFRSDFIRIEKGKTYELAFDMKGRWTGIFFPKVFVKGYALQGDQRREKFRMYKACRTQTQGREWEHFSRTFHPTAEAPDVRWIRVQIYAYWPPGIFHFDNVVIREVVEK